MIGLATWGHLALWVCSMKLMSRRLRRCGQSDVLHLPVVAGLVAVVPAAILAIPLEVVLALVALLAHVRHYAPACRLMPDQSGLLWPGAWIDREDLAPSMPLRAPGTPPCVAGLVWSDRA